MKRFLVPVAILAALACSCSSGPDRANPSDRPTGTAPPVQLVAALQSSDSCEALLAWIKTEARTRVGPYGFSDGRMYAMEGDMAVSGAARSSAGFAEDGAANTTMAPEPATASDGGADKALEQQSADESAAATTGTNNQEVGVDEIDRFKTDGRRVVMTDGDGRLMAVDITGPTPRKLGQIDLDMYGVQLFLDGDTVIAVGTPQPPADSTTYREQVAIARVSLGDAAPVVTSRATVDGYFVSGRMTDGSMRLVVGTRGPAELGFVSPNGGDARSIQLAIETNQRVIDESTLEDWIPTWTSPGGAEAPLLDCGAVFHPASWSGSSMLSVLTLGDDLADLHPVAVVGGGDTVYASTTGLYVATQVQPTTTWDEQGNAVAPEQAPEEQTAIHRFDVAVPGTTVYQGSGNVPGHVLNQYAMSERNGDLRVATTVDGGWWGGGRPVPMPMPVEDCADCSVTNDAAAPASASSSSAQAKQTTNRSLLTVLRLSGNQLEQVGQVDGLGPNEQIQAVRVVEDRAYVVTFRQTDPLYVIDLADPTAPTVLGELKEPGFSAYLHPVGQDRMLGIGSSGTDEGRITGAKVALYDTSDPTKPRAVATLPIQDGYTSAGGDSHAFTWDADRHLAFIPMSLQPAFDSKRAMYSEPIAGVAVYRVEGDAVTWVGWIDHADHAVQQSGGGVPECPPNASCIAPDSMPAYASPVDRTAVVGDRVIAASMAGVSQVSIDGFAETGWVGWD